MIRRLRQALRRGLRVMVGDARPPASARPHQRGASDPTPLAVTAPDGLPFPTPELHRLVSGSNALDYTAFWTVGRSCADMVTRLLKRDALDLDDSRAILDFGCGCGRVTRHLQSWPRVQVHGTDYNPELIEWCRRHLTFATFEVNQLHPPLLYRASTFDFVYAFSVFTHFPESLQRSWLAEMSRVLKPGGRLLLTTQGAAYAREYLSRDEMNVFATGELVVLNQERAGKNECLAYHPADYVRTNLVTGFEVLDFIPGDVIDLSRGLIAQDTYLLGRPR